VNLQRGWTRPLTLALCAATVVVASCVDATRPIASSESTAASAPKHPSFTLLPAGTLRPAFGPQQITRSTGKPQTSLFTISGYGPAAVLHVVNGDAQGNNRATSGSITVDGAEVVGPSSFNKKVASFDVNITLGNPSTIGAQLAGAPGSTISISIDAEGSTAASIGTAGGTLHLLGTQVTLVFPAGAVSTTTAFTAAPADPPTPNVIPGTAVDLGPTGTTFAAPITVTLAYDPSQLPAGVKPAYLYMAWWNVDHWEALPGNTVNAANSTVSATTTHFSIYALLPSGVEFCPTDPTSIADFQTALNNAPVGGNLWVCDGSFTVAGVLSKALTMRAENPGNATLVQGPTGAPTDAIVTIAGISSGTVSVTGMNFTFEKHAIRTLDFDSLSVTGSTFTGTATATATSLTSAVLLDLTSTPPARAYFDHDTFAGGYYGLQQAQPVRIETYNSNFHDQGSFSLIFSTASGAQNIPPNGIALSRSGKAEHNSFTNCGTGVCIALEQSGADTVRFNTITMFSGSVNDGIFINRFGETAAQTIGAVVTDNSFTGHAAIGDPTVSANWGIRSAIVENAGIPGVVDDIERNQVNTAFAGFQLRGGGGNAVSVFVQDNQLAHMYHGWEVQSATDVITAHRNDFLDYVVPITSSPAAPAAFAPSLAAHSLTCNWWGSAGGPIGVLPGVNVAAYTPFATAPIANTATVCTP
jgi:hypothetical protein